MHSHLAPGTVGRARGRHQSEMPATTVFVFLYVVAVILFSSRPGYSLVATVSGFMLALVFFVELLVHKHRLCFPIPLLMFFLFVCYAIVQMIWAPGNTTSLITLIQLLVFAFILVNYIVISRSMLSIELAVYLGTIISFIYILVFHDYGTDNRIGATVGNQNEYAYVLMCGVLLISRRLLLTWQRGLWNLKAFVPCVLYLALSMYGILYLTGSRTGTAVTLASLGLLALYWAICQPGRRRIWALLGIGVVFVSLGFAVGLSPQSSRFIPLGAYLRGDAIEDNSMLIRDSMLRGGVELWLKRPFTGWGLDMYRNVSGWGTYAHDNYVELLVDGGVIGLLSYLMVHVSAVACLVRSRFVFRDAWARAEVFWGAYLGSRTSRV